MTVKSYKLTKEYCDAIFQKFADNYFLSINGTIDIDKKKIVEQYKKIINMLCADSLNFQNANNMFAKLFSLKIQAKIPYVVAINEINYLKNIFSEILIEKKAHEAVLSLFKIFNSATGVAAKQYFKEYIEKLLSINNIRITSMSDILKRNIITHYKEHLEWLSSLAAAIIQDNKQNIPERDPHCCNFGKWLDSDGKATIHNNSKYKSIIELHNSLHFFAEKIYAQFEEKNYHAFLSYLEKCELISLNIGTELALVDNMLLNKMVIKDPLTKALNRNALNQIFESQYEIAYATGNPLIFTMCDLDYFKKINDTYGHLAGDKMLVEFVKIVKNKIRNSDILVRYGGEEFIIILPAMTTNTGLIILSAIKDTFASFELNYEGHKITTTVSMGMIEINPDDYYNINKLEEYIALADTKLYIAKNSGRNQIYT